MCLLLGIEYPGGVCVFQIALISSELFQCVSVSTPTGMVWLVCVFNCSTSTGMCVGGRVSVGILHGCVEEA